MKNIFRVFICLSVWLFSATACNITDITPIPDLNNPTVESVLTNATSVQINRLGIGVQSIMRNGYFDMSWIGGSIGRECIRFNKTDNRYYTELLGKSAIDPAGIFIPWYLSFYSTRRRAEILSLSANNSSALSATDKSAAKGFAKTVQAWAMLNELNMMGEVGIRTTISDLLAPGDLLNPGGFVSYADGLTYVKQLCDDGAAALDGGGSAFPFPVASGFAGFNTPANFKKFNRAVAAKVAMYQKDWDGMLTALNASYLNLTGSLTAGPLFTYSITSGDIQNQFYLPIDDANNPIAVQKNFVLEAEAGDTRVTGPSVREGGTSKVRKRTASVTLGGLPASDYEFQGFKSNTSSISFLRNEELILMYAEAKIQKSAFPDAVIALDKVRGGAGLKSLATAKLTIIADQAKLIDEMLNQRRYSLYMEGANRWFDTRRYNRLATLPVDLPGLTIITNFPKPQSEIDWDGRPK